MKSIIATYIIAAFLLGAGIAGSALIVRQQVQLNELVTTYEQELRVEQEYYKACSARMMYLDHIVDKHGIEVIQ